MEPYVTNPFIYITDNDSDFKGEKGKVLKEYFKKIYNYVDLFQIFIVIFTIIALESGASD